MNTGTAKAAQRCIVERFQQIFLGQLARTQALEQRIAAAGDIGVVVDIARQMRVGIAAFGGCQHTCNAGMVDEVMADLGCRCGVATPDAGRAHHANAGAGLVLQLMQQLFRAQHGAGE